MASSKVIKEIIKEMNSKATFVEGFDEALIGYGRQHDNKYIAIYDASICLKIISKDKEVDIEEAYKIFDTCLKNGFKNDFSPIFINDFRKTQDPKNIKNLDKTLKEIIGEKND